MQDWVFSTLLFSSEHSTATALNMTTNVTTASCPESKYRKAGGCVGAFSRALLSEPNSSEDHYWNPVTSYRSAHPMALHPDPSSTSSSCTTAGCNSSAIRAVRVAVHRPEGRLLRSLCLHRLMWVQKAACWSTRKDVCRKAGDGAEGAICLYGKEKCSCVSSPGTEVSHDRKTPCTTWGEAAQSNCTNMQVLILGYRLKFLELRQFLLNLRGYIMWSVFWFFSFLYLRSRWSFPGIIHTPPCPELQFGCPEWVVENWSTLMQRACSAHTTQGLLGRF